MPTPRKEENEETSPKRVKLDDNDSRKTLSTILEREIRNEISIRRNDLETIEQRIFKTRQALVKIRQGVVSEYYRQNYKGILQIPPHPAIKNTFQGKYPSNTEGNISLNYENITEDINSIESENNYDNQNGCESKEIIENKQQQMKLPRYIRPKYRDKDIIKLCEPRGNVKKKKIRLSIGNISKWIYNEDSNGGATHKWTIYVKNSDPDIDISSVVSKVTFYLHSSYKPNDVVTVDYAPFILSRRGWGEFPLRVQLHFINSLDKPVDVIHNLKLDATHSGLDIFGGETIVEVWAHCNDNEISDCIEEEEIVAQATIYEDGVQLSSECIKPTISSDDFIRTSSFSDLSLTTDISNDILSEIFGDQDDIKVKEEIIKIPDKSLQNSPSTNNIVQEENTNDNYKLKTENIFGLSSSSTDSITVKNEVTVYESQCKDEISSTDNEWSSVLEGTDDKSNNVTIDEQELSTNDIQSVSSNEINEYDFTSTEITYDPIECLNLVNSEIEINTEEEYDNSKSNIEQEQSVNTMSCKEYLENFIDTDFNKIEDEEGCEVRQEIEIIEDGCTESEIILNNTTNNQAININQNNKLLSIIDDNRECDTNIPHTRKVLSTTNVLPVIDRAVEINNKECLNKQITFNVINKSQLVKLSNNDNGKHNKLVVNESSNIKNIIISPAKSNNVNQIKLTSFKDKDNLHSIESRNNITDRGRVSGTISTNSKAVLATNKNSLDKVYIELPDGQLKELCTGIAHNIKPISKPIIIESIPTSKKKNTSLHNNISSSKNSPFRFNEPSNLRKLMLQPGYRLLNPNRAAIKLNGQPQQNARTLLQARQGQFKKYKRLLKVNSSTPFVQSGIVIPSTSSSTSPQFIKIPTVLGRPTIVENRNIVIQRKVMPGESLLKKGNPSQQPDTTNQDIPPSSLVLTESELIKRCPTERIEYAVNWLIKQFPLVNEKARIESFKSKHPYCAIDRDSFLKWPFAKQRAAEWMRAKAIGRILAKVWPNFKCWTTVQIYDWARLRGYTPLGQLFKCNNSNHFINNFDNLFPYTAPEIKPFLRDIERLDEQEIEIDVTSEPASRKEVIRESRSEARIYLPLEEKLKDIGNYVYENCDKIGTHFYEEEIIPGVVYPAVERVLISVFHSVFDDILRRSLNASCIRNGVMPATEIIEKDVKMALLSRCEFDLFTNEGLGVLPL